MNKLNVLLISTFLIVATAGFAFALPNGASTVNEITTSRGATTGAANNSAYAGNVTEIDISGSSITQAWQGYYGNVTGVITLENSGGDVMYNWSTASPSGEIFASNASSVTWGSIGCMNWTTYGAGLEAFYGIGANDVDGINETFSNSTAHNAFSVGSVSIAADACYATFVYDNTGTGVDDNFEEVLLHDGTKHVFAALLEDDLTGFDDASHDFEMLVVEDGHNGDTQTTPYFFYVELE